MPRSISVLGAGSWGTALALLAARNGCDTLLWTHNQRQFELLSQQRENQRYLRGFLFPQKLKVTASLDEVVTFSPLLLITVPSHAFKATLQKIKPCLSDEPQIAWATKGFNSENGSLMSEAVSEVLGGVAKIAVLSGPTFAKEVAAICLTAITIA